MVCVVAGCATLQGVFTSEQPAWSDLHSADLFGCHVNQKLDGEGEIQITSKSMSPPLPALSADWVWHDKQLHFEVSGPMGVTGVIVKTQRGSSIQLRFGGALSYALPQIGIHDQKIRLDDVGRLIYQKHFVGIYDTEVICLLSFLLPSAWIPAAKQGLRKQDKQGHEILRFRHENRRISWKYNTKYDVGVLEIVRPMWWKIGELRLQVRFSAKRNGAFHVMRIYAANFGELLRWTRTRFLYSS